MELANELTSRVIATLISFRREKRWLYGVAILLSVSNYFTQASNWYVIAALWTALFVYVFMRRRFISRIIERETGLDYGDQYNLWVQYLKSDVLATQDELIRFRKGR